MRKTKNSWGSAAIGTALRLIRTGTARSGMSNTGPGKGISNSRPVSQRRTRTAGALLPLLIAFAVFAALVPAIGHAQSPQNTPATGAPVISGTARVSQELSVDTSGIADAEGKTMAEEGDAGYAYTYKWFRVDSDGTSNKTEISGETASTYTLASDDDGKKIIVEVSFTDDEDNAEGPLASDAYPDTGTVEAAPVVTIEADQESAVFLADSVSFTLSRTGDTDEELDVTVALTQSHEYLDAASLAKTVTFDEGDSDATLTIPATEFTQIPEGEPVASGTLTATVNAGTGYGVGTPAAADVDIVVALIFSFDKDSYEVDESDGTLSFKVIARTGEGAASPTSLLNFAVIAVADEAGSPSDFAALELQLQIPAADFECNDPGTEESGCEGGVFEAEKSLTVSIVDDDEDENGEEFSLELLQASGLPIHYQNFATQDGDSCGTICEVSVTIKDNDIASLVVAPGMLEIDEDGTGAFTVKLATKPTEDVTVSVTSDNTDAATVSDDELTFTDETWNMTQEVTVRGVEDADDANEEVTIDLSTTSMDANYNALRVSLDVLVDDSAPVVTIEADQESAVFRADSVSFTLSRTGVTDEELDVTVALTQSHEYLDAASLAKTVTFSTGSSEATLTIPDSEFTQIPEGEPVASGTLTATVNAGTGYEAGTPAAADVDIVVALIFSFDKDSYEVDESDETLSFKVIARTGEGAAAPTSLGPVFVQTGSDEAVVPDDYTPISEQLVIPTTDFECNDSATADSGCDGGVFVAEKSLTVGIVDDDEDEDDEVFNLSMQINPNLSVAHQNVATQDGNSCGARCEVDATIKDNDTAALVVDPDMLGVDEDGTGTFTVKLATKPTEDVTVSVTSDNTDAATVSDDELTFTDETWNMTQVVTVSGEADDNSVDEDVTIDLSATSSDTFYDGLTKAINVLVDDSAPDVTVSFETASYSVHESDDESTTGVTESEVTIKVTLSEAPKRTVTILIEATGQDGASSDDYSGVPGTLVFDSEDTEKSFTFAATHDEIDDDGESVKLSFGDLPDNVTGGATVEAIVSISDDDTAGLIFDPTPLELDEGGTATFTLRLATEPSVDVTVSVRSRRSGIATASPDSVTFTPSDWQDERTITVSGDHDTDTRNESDSILLKAIGGEYEGASGTVAVSVTDDDALEPSLVIEPALLTIREGDSGEFAVRLATQPTSSVTVQVSSEDRNAVSISSPRALTFTTGDWQDEQTVTLMAEDDTDSRNENLVDITIEASGGGYDGRTGRVKVTVIDDDSSPAMIVVNPERLSIREGGTGSFEVSLARDPEETLEVHVFVYDLLLLTADEVVLTFTTSDWHDAQTVTLTALEDNDADDASLSIGLFAYREGDTSQTIARGAAFVRVVDNDTTGIVLNQTGLSVEEEGFGTFTARLSSRPSEAVTIEVSSADTTVATVAPVSLTFTPSDWQDARTIRVNGVADADARPERTTVSLEVSASGRDYEDLKAQVSVRVRDDDPKIKVNFGAPSFSATEGGSPATVVVELSRADSEDATFPLDLFVPNVMTRPSDYSELPESVTVRAGDTSTSFTVTAVDDDVTDEDGNRIELRLLDLPAGFAKGNTARTIVNLIDNDDSQIRPTFSLQSASISADEGDGIVFKIDIERPTDRHLLLFFWTSEGTATKYTDYDAPHPADQNINAGYGVSSVEIRIPTVDDDIVEPDETFELTLARSGSYKLGDPRKTVATILDNDNNGRPYIDTIRADTDTTAFVSVGEPVRGDLETADDVDWYGTLLTRDHCYRVQLSGRNHESGLTLAEPLIPAIYRHDGSSIVGTTGYGRGPEPAEVRLKLDADGTYYVGVQQSFRNGRHPDGGSYSLSITDLGTEDTSCGDAKPGL